MTETGAPTAAAARRGYRPFLDGMRAIAVLLVVAFHSNLDLASGGFVGVDVFFVLSGYLVTGLLIEELDRTDGLGFRRFYARRVRRLLPLAALVLVITAVAFARLSPPVIVSEASGSFTAAFLYVANWWWFISESTEYLGSNIESSPILHYWSLAIEEQFYVIWPLVVFGGYRVTRRFGPHLHLVLAGAFGALGVASATAAAVIARSDVNRAYYGTDTRAYQLLLGAVLALLPVLAVGKHRRQLVGIAAAAALAAVAFLATDITSLSPVTRGGLAAIATAVAIAALESGHAGPVRTGLSWQPLVEIGKISYGVYLWHLPAMYVLNDQFELSSTEMLLAATPISLALAFFSGWVLESPVRRTPRLDAVPARVVVTGLSLSVLGGLVIAPQVLDRGTTTEVVLSTPDDVGDGGQGTPVDLGEKEQAEPDVLVIDWDEARSDAADVPECRAVDPAECTVVEGDEPHVVLIGDSHIRVWTSAFIPHAEAEDYTLSVLWMPSCSWHLDTMVVIGDHRRIPCIERQNEWFDETLPALDPDIVVLIHRATFDPARPFMASLDAFLDASDAVVNGLVEQGIDVVIVEPTPLVEPDLDPLACLSDGGSLDDCSFDATEEPTALETEYRRLAELDGVVSVDLDRLACPALPRCMPIVDGTVVFRDHSHMTATYAATLADELTEAGLFDLVLVPAD